MQSTGAPQSPAADAWDVAAALGLPVPLVVALCAELAAAGLLAVARE